MINIQVCIGSSCHLKGAPIIVEKLNEMIQNNHLEKEINLFGSFCTGNCNRQGVTLIVNDEIFKGVTPDTFLSFWDEHVKKLLEK